MSLKFMLSCFASACVVFEKGQLWFSMISRERMGERPEMAVWTVVARLGETRNIQDLILFTSRKNLRRKCAAPGADVHEAVLLKHDVSLSNDPRLNQRQPNED